MRVSRVSPSPRVRGFSFPRAAVLLALLASAGCDASPTEAEGSCIAVVNVQGTLYGDTEVAGTIAPETVSEEPFLTVTLNTGCLDQGQPQRELASGESNFLEPGSTLHTVAGIPASERLVFWSGVVKEWLPLAPLGG